MLATSRPAGFSYLGRGAHLPLPAGVQAEERFCCSVTLDAGTSLNGCLQLQPCPEHRWEPRNNLGEGETKDRFWGGRWSNTHLSATAWDPSACPLGPHGLSNDSVQASLLAPILCSFDSLLSGIQNVGNILSLTLASKSAPGEPHPRPSQEGSTSLLHPNFRGTGTTGPQLPSWL